MCGSVHIIEKFVCFRMLSNIVMYMVMFIYDFVILLDDFYDIFLFTFMFYMSCYEIF